MRILCELQTPGCVQPDGQPPLAIRVTPAERDAIVAVLPGWLLPTGELDLGRTCSGLARILGREVIDLALATCRPNLTRSIQFTVRAE